MPARNPKLPEYPRPVSPICADEIPICDDTIVYCDQSRDFEEDEEQRAAKRRRIESHATAYLRGQPLFILTAQLRGPFDGGWTNPWAREKVNKTKKTGTNQQIPTPPPKPARGKKQNSPVLRGEHVAQAAPDTSIHVTKQTKESSSGRNRSPVTSSVQGGKRTSPHLEKEAEPPKHNKVKNWLRTNAAYKGPEHAQPDLLSSSPSDGKTKKCGHPRRNIERPVQVDADVNIASDQGSISCRMTALRQLEGFKSSFSSPVKPQTRQIAPGARDCHTSPLRPTNQDIHNHYEATKQPWTNEYRAEYAILKSKREAAHRILSAVDVVPPALGLYDNCDKTTASSEHQPQPGRLQLFTIEREKESEPKRNEAPGLNGTSASLPSAQDAAPPNHSERAPHSLTKETAESSTTTDLPSAQGPSPPVLASLPSDLSSHGQMFHEALDRCYSEVVDAVDVERAAAIDVSAAGDTTAHARDVPYQDHIPLTYPPDPVLHSQHQSQNKADSFGTLHSVTDHAFVLSKSMRKAGRGNPKASFPAGIAKARATKNKRRMVSSTENIPSESSRGSIKSVLKVAKPTVANQNRVGDSKTAMPLGLEQQSSADGGQRSAPNDSGSPNGLRTSAPRSILKSFLQSSMRAPLQSSNPGLSSSSRQDAQRQQLLKLVESDADFDLEAAIDDLGSFLGTWDEEKQAFAAAATTTSG
ncbi:uncharacterized protein Z519_11524 [Cladophialophora bantiana CBS 173.52]|uniref:Uncharacterized protein n=1 Tax=Cladophialophora bantiana (strain ATCC 10958 / CBS 173.52 / CDC B-1940 / NIH 8579) TaxID=1442370 RepID=A0A0D2HTZ6_CLAB1|nr:uncharacterized protein Z519_11524 [Cladophialophora bantiana CBS 173.52]KIW87939.1 hypothetical protein Z519_11524 [Cladophialophora bantiana CBS 173.52]